MARTGFGFARAEAEFEHVAPGALAVALDSSAEGFRVNGGQVHAGVYGGFRVGGGLSEDQLLGQVEELGLFAAGSGEEGAHGDCLGSGFVLQCLRPPVISHILRGFAYDFLTNALVYNTNTAQGVANLPQPNFAQTRLV